MLSVIMMSGNHPRWDLKIRDFDELSQTVIHIEFCWWEMYLYWRSAFNLPWLCSLAKLGQGASSHLQSLQPPGPTPNDDLTRHSQTGVPNASPMQVFPEGQSISVTQLHMAYNEELSQ